MIVSAMMNIHQETKTIIAHGTTEMREGATEIVADTGDMVDIAMEMIVKKIEVVQEKEKNSASSKDLA